ncbi:antibiotic biosynthesis monooxygenase [Luteimonas sp. Y-2-2-4F]|nr:putative quinol monooxygenase [Luteimonas sp. Y-2-2-4F]MCD9031775.1 antibiotic biosynthesis monooxygenase [Luteimonas sp. Y-2-2-4F]
MLHDDACDPAVRLGSPCHDLRERSCSPTIRSSLTEPTEMYGLIGKMKAQPGRRDELIAILLEGLSGMSGCLSYIVAQDPTDPDAIWVTEAWDSQESHQASLQLPSVRQAISRGKPLIAGFGERFETVPVGGEGLGLPDAAT